MQLRTLDLFRRDIARKEKQNKRADSQRMELPAQLHRDGHLTVRREKCMKVEAPCQEGITKLELETRNANGRRGAIERMADLTLGLWCRVVWWLELGPDQTRPDTSMLPVLNADPWQAVESGKICISLRSTTKLRPNRYAITDCSRFINRKSISPPISTPPLARFAHRTLVNNHIPPVRHSQSWLPSKESCSSSSWATNPPLAPPSSLSQTPKSVGPISSAHVLTICSQTQSKI